jgi:hypothetical protein
MAFYRAGWRKRKPIFKGQFLANANGNFLNTCVLEWCKLFGDSRAQHYWKKVISDPEEFFNGLLKKLKTTETDLDNYVKEVRTYRDKFVAHLDSEEVMYPPKLDVIKMSVTYLYGYLLKNEDEEDFFPDAPTNATVFYKRFLVEGKKAYKS